MKTKNWRYSTAYILARRDDKNLTEGQLKEIKLFFKSGNVIFYTYENHYMIALTSRQEIRADHFERIKNFIESKDMFICTYQTPKKIKDK